MVIERFHCPFAGLSGCCDGGGNGLTNSYLIKHLHDRHCKDEAQAITKHSLITDLVVFERAEATLKRMGIWLCGVCFKTHTLRIKCRHVADIVSPPDIGDSVVRFVLYDLTKPLVPSCSQPHHVDGLLLDQPDGFTLALLDSLFLKGLRTVKSIHLKCHLGFSRALKGALVWSNLECKSANKRKLQEESIINAIRSWGVPGGSWQVVKETLVVSALPMLDLDKEDLDLCIPIDHQRLIASQDVVLDRIKSFPRGKCPTWLGEYIASAPLTPLVKPGGGIRSIAVGTVWRRLVSKVSATMIGHSLDGYLDGLQFGVGVPGGGEAIIHAVNRLVEDRGDDVGLSMLLVDFQNAFNLAWNLDDGTVVGDTLVAWNLDDGTVVGDTLVVSKVLDLIMEDGPRCGLFLNVDKTELFWPSEDPRSRLEGVFPHNISRPLHGVKLLGGPVSVDADFSSALVMKRISKTIGLLDAIAKINDPQCELLLIRACAGVSKLYFDMRTCPPRVFELAQLSFDIALRDVLNYAFIASRLQSDSLQTKLLRHVGIVASGSTCEEALCVFNNAMGIDFLSNPSEMPADVARGHGSDGGGDDRPPPYQHLQKIYNGKKAALKEKYWVPEEDGTSDLERIRRGRPSHISEVDWDAQLAFLNDPKNLARAAQNKQNLAKSNVVCRQGSRSIAALRDMHLESQPEYGGGSESGGCGDDEPGDDEDGGEDKEDEEDS
nr:putative reverse transcriptase domain-containing protein [Tanacetum cinerariifolium]